VYLLVKEEFYVIKMHGTMTKIQLYNSEIMRRI